VAGDSLVTDDEVIDRVNAVLGQTIAVGDVWMNRDNWSYTIINFVDGYNVMVGDMLPGSDAFTVYYIFRYWTLQKVGPGPRYRIGKWTVPWAGAAEETQQQESSMTQALEAALKCADDLSSTEQGVQLGGEYNNQLQGLVMFFDMAKVNAETLEERAVFLEAKASLENCIALSKKLARLK
jgi:hypothetical protein